MARLTEGQHDLQVMTLKVDRLELENRISLVKIDAEGHEMPVLLGMHSLLDRDHPVLIVENSSAEIGKLLAQHGYQSRKLEGSSNLIFEHATPRSSA